MKLSTTMQAAVDHAKANGGKLCRYPGGFWMKAGLAGRAVERGVMAGDIWFGTETIRALVKRGLAVESAWRRNDRGDFAVEITIK